MERLSWQIFSRGDRIEVIEQIKSAIFDHNGYIMNFEMFSDLALGMVLVVEEKDVAALYSEIGKIASIDGRSPLSVSGKRGEEIYILVNIVFARGSGDLEHEKPAV